MWDDGSSLLGGLENPGQTGAPVHLLGAFTGNLVRNRCDLLT